ncbi:hypothetical protein HHK36_007998 [Tetracentron sinense]|uniref:WRKY domain-containing protein n=1 Tax=Tetracentron sinense TaxID=13715 RepID=A0A834ZET5_TETSI|nr:hypothetical protein HHK36_007998 [Tetracentron sinense]
MENTDQPQFELSDYLKFDDCWEEDTSFMECPWQTPISPQRANDDSFGYTSTTRRSSNMKCTNGAKRIRMGVGFRIAFRTKSELEIMDDGFKWRKYGKKTVKNSPNPRPDSMSSGNENRNYYRCSTGGCHVKKRVERDREDSSYVITTYEGVHNHESPCVIYYNQMPLMVPPGWTLQASHPSS